MNREYNENVIGKKISKTCLTEYLEAKMHDTVLIFDCIHFQSLTLALFCSYVHEGIMSCNLVEWTDMISNTRIEPT